MNFFRFQSLAALVALLLVAGGLCACKPALPKQPESGLSQGSGSSTQEEPSSTPSESSAPGSKAEVSSAPGSAAAPSSGAPASKAPQASQAVPAPLTGTYLPKEDLGIYNLSLALQEDGSYALSLKALVLTGSISGTYSREKDALTLHVTKADLPGFSAENAGDLHLTVQEDGSLHYVCDEFLAQAGIKEKSITFCKK